MTEDIGQETIHASVAQELDSALANGREALAELIPPRPVSKTENPEAIWAELDDAQGRHLPCSAADVMWRINTDFDGKVREVIWRLDLRYRNLRFKYLWRRKRKTIIATLRLCAFVAMCWLIFLISEELLAAPSVPVEATGRSVSHLLGPPGTDGLP